MKKRIFVCLGFFSLLTVGLVFFASMREKKDLSLITLYGNVDVRQVDISFRVPGLVRDLFFEEGDQVKEGSLLCTLDLTPYDSQLQEAIASGQSIKFDLDNAEILLKRRQALIGIEAISQEDLDNALANRNKLIADFKRAKSSIQVAQDNISYTKAYAPTSGIILTRIREPGTVVNATDPIYTLSISSPVWIRAFVNEPYLGKVHYGMEAQVFTDTGRSYKGVIGFISPVAEFTPKTVETAQLRTDLVYRLRIYVDNPDRGLVQGMPVTVKLSMNNSEASSP